MKEPEFTPDISQLDGAADVTGISDEENSEDNSENSLINDQTPLTLEHGARLLLTNARSLKPKIDSMVDAFQSLKLDFSCITETWFRGGRDLTANIEDLEGATGIKILHKSRDGRKCNAEGGRGNCI